MKDQLGAVIVGATVTISVTGGVAQSAQTNGEGLYSFSSLLPGTYKVQAAAAGFAPYEQEAVVVHAGRPTTLNIEMGLVITEEVRVADEPAVTGNPEDSTAAIVLRSAELESLPDDPDELAAALQALAGPAAGPNGGEVYVDGVLVTRLPSKNSIKEVRLNSNAWSAEYDRIGFGRVDITTKPGTDSLHARLFFNFNDESFNSRNPFAPNRAPFQSRLYGGSLSGPIKKKKSSYFLDFERREIADNVVVNALILDPTLQITPFSLALVTPQRLHNFSVRTDYLLNETNMFVARYNYSNFNLRNAGVGEFALPTRAFDTSNSEHLLNLSESALINGRLVSETRFQFIHRRREQTSDNSLPAIEVLDAFSGGPSPLGRSSSDENRWELSNVFSLVTGRHTLRFGGRIRSVSITDISPSNFGGTFTFAGGQAVQLDANNQVVRNPDGTPVFTQISSLERYRRTLLFQQQGLPPNSSELGPDQLGFGPSQLSISTGDPRAGVRQTDVGVFLHDNWVVRSNLVVGLGLRYEKQTNIESPLNLAPRLTVAWLPRKGKSEPKTVVRVGMGVFYERFPEGFTLIENRYNGLTFQQFIINDPAILTQFPNVPAPNILSTLTATQTVRRVAPDLQSPYTIQMAASVERQLPYKSTLNISFINIRTLHLIRTRNINAPLPETFVPGNPLSGVRPFGNVGNIFEYEASGKLNQQLLRMYATTRAVNSLFFYVEYMLNRVRSDIDGDAGFPASSYDLSSEYGRSVFDFRQRLIAGGTYTTKWGITLSPFIIWRASIPFNIITGRDTNGDGVFTERPAFATDLTKPGVVVTRFGAFDPNPAPGQTIIPRNYGKGPSYFSADLRLSKTLGFGTLSTATPAAKSSATTGGKPAASPVSSESRYYLTLGLQIQNIFNTTNPALPIGNLSSPFFGQSTATSGFYGFGSGNFAGNRRLTWQASFRF